jgi:proline iminopeptidase
VLHGTLDRVCRPEAALAVQARLRGSRWRAVHGAGHDPFHPAMAQAMREAVAELNVTRETSGAEDSASR